MAFWKRKHVEQPRPGPTEAGNKDSSAGNLQLRREAERLIAKGNYKDAVKQAKLCHRDAPTSENHFLLERAYLLRAEELQRRGMPNAAREVAQHLREFGVTDPASFEQVANLFLAMGMSRESQELVARLDAPEIRERFAVREADLAVVHPDRATNAPAIVREGAQAVRAALEAVQRDDATAGLELLRDVTRTSPFADWKLFARGLVAWNRGNTQDSSANWDRLDPGRAAARIARQLRASESNTQGEGKAGQVPDLATLERSVLGVSVLGPLDQLRKLVAGDDWTEAIRKLATLRQLLAHVDPGHPARLTRILHTLIIQAASRRDIAEARSLLQEFTHAAERLPIDPRWNRFQALAWEDGDGQLEMAIRFWKHYLDDLENLSVLAPPERVLARALVLKHMAEGYLHELEHQESKPRTPFMSRSSVSPTAIEKMRKQVVSHLEESLKLAPDQRDTHTLLLRAHEDWKQADKAAAAARRMLETFPDDLGAITFLADHHAKRGEYEQALGHTRRARTLKPLDKNLAVLEWSMLIDRARESARGERWDEGRAWLDEADRLMPDQARNLTVRVVRTALELKAGRTDLAESRIVEDKERLAEDTPLWLALSIEAIRQELPKLQRQRFEARWLSAITGKVKSETAGTLASIMSAFVEHERPYEGCATHLAQVADYLRRTTRIKYREQDLRRVCEFLEELPKETSLYEKLVNRGIKLFPDSPRYHYLAGNREIAKGPFGGGNPRLAKTHLEKALKLAEKSRDPSSLELLPKIRAGISAFQDIGTMLYDLPFMLPGMGGMGAGFGPGPGPSTKSGGMPSLQDVINILGPMLDQMEEGDDEDEYDGDGGFYFDPAYPFPTAQRADDRKKAARKQQRQQRKKQRKKGK